VTVAVLRELHTDGVTVTARVTVDPADPYLCGHFPGNPVYPGVFLLDLLERAVVAVTPPGTRLLAVSSARFTTPAREGADVELSVRVPEAGQTVTATFTGDGTRFATIKAVFGPESPP
jgi:3-hydroxyacyl-[acyl-carrier-protein] dehydratase